ncbi:MAG: hypothetical protein JWP13_398 [Candidatus Saccharibacteria bacterium]|nr:hypothetical protein [Candidatus Saccharibacteria bacterium]
MNLNQNRQEYTVELTTLFDANEDVTFRIEPPVRFLTEEAREAFGKNVIRLISRRADYGEMGDASVQLTHNSAGETATLGYARVPALRYGTGKEVFLQGLLVALNGEYPDLYSDNSIHRI